MYTVYVYHTANTRMILYVYMKLRIPVWYCICIETANSHMYMKLRIPVCIWYCEFPHVYDTANSRMYMKKMYMELRIPSDMTATARTENWRKLTYIITNPVMTNIWRLIWRKWPILYRIRWFFTTLYQGAFCDSRSKVVMHEQHKK